MSLPDHLAGCWLDEFDLDGSLKDESFGQVAWYVKDKCIRFFNTLGHRLLQAIADHPEHKVTWPFPPDTGILDPLHRDPSRAPHDDPAVLDERDGVWWESLLLRWQQEFRDLHGVVVDLDQVRMAHLCRLLGYVAEWFPWPSKASNQQELAAEWYMRLANDQPCVLLLRALGQWNEDLVSLLERDVFSVRQTSVAEEAIDATGVYRFLGRLSYRHSWAPDRELHDGFRSSCEKWDWFAFTLQDAAGKVWPLLRGLSTGDHVWVEEVRCAETGALLSSYRSAIDEPNEFHYHEAYFSHPIAQSFALTQEQLNMPFAEEVWPPIEVDDPPDDPEPVLCKVESHICWRTSSFTIGRQHPLARQRLAVLQGQWRAMKVPPLLEPVIDCTTDDETIHASYVREMAAVLEQHVLCLPRDLAKFAASFL
jgi:hypothetical protein